MKTIYSENELQEAIFILEIQQKEEEQKLRNQFNIAYDSVKPLNLILNTVKQAVSSTEIKNNLAGSSLGLVSGYLAKLLFQGLTHNPVRKIIGSALMFVVTNIVAKNPETIEALSRKIFPPKNKQS